MSLKDFLKRHAETFVERPVREPRIIDFRNLQVPVEGIKLLVDNKEFFVDRINREAQTIDFHGFTKDFKPVDLYTRDIFWLRTSAGTARYVVTKIHSSETVNQKWYFAGQATFIRKLEQND